MSKEKIIIWIHRGEDQFYDCHNKDGEHLGFLQLEKVGRHTHWCWYQIVGIKMSPGCLQEVRDKQKELFKQRKVK